MNQGLNKDISNETYKEIINYSDTESNEEENDDSIELEEEEKDDSVEIKEESKQITTEFIMPDIQTNKREPKEKELNDNISRRITCLGNKRKKKLKPENIRKSAFYYPMIFLKKLFEKQFGLDLDSFNCEKVFGVSIKNMRQILNWKIYQILGYYPKYYENIIKLANSQMSKEKKYMFFYFMTRTYEELYTCYITSNVNFPCIPNCTLRISSFTLNRAIDAKIKEKERNKEDKEYIEKYIAKFNKLSENMIDDLKNGKNERKEKKIRQLIPKVCKEFEDMRNTF